MMTRNCGKQIKFHTLTIENLVPEEHFLRKLDCLVDFSFIYEEIKEYYCHHNGRPSIDPVILVKYLLVGYLYGIESERRIEQEIQVNMAYRWFLGLDLDERVPDHSTISQNRRRRFGGENLFHCLFEHILHLCMEKGLVDGKLILTDSTHVKANASFKANVKVLAEHKITDYMERLDLYEAQERKRLEDSGAIRPQRTRCIKKERKKAEKTGTSLIYRAMEDMGIRLHTPGTSGGVNYKVKFTREYFKYEK